MKRAYGLPYVGSKNRYAEEILNILPAGSRLVDLFAGGGAITDCALRKYSDKWSCVLYNEKDPAVYELFKKCCSGFYTSPDFDRADFWTSREEFFKTDDLARVLCFSFGNIIGRRAYFCSKEKEPLGRAAFFGGHSGERCNPLTRLHRLENLGWLKNCDRLDFSNLDYKDFTPQPGDVIYCDPPYDKTAKDVYRNSGTFDFSSFVEWAKQFPQDVYFSSYEKPELSEYCVWRKETWCTLSSGGSTLKRIECLYKV